MEAGAPGATMVPAVVHVAEEQEPKLDPVTVHRHNMVVKPAQDPPHQVLAVTQFHVQLMEAGALGAPMDRAVKHVGEDQKSELERCLLWADPSVPSGDSPQLLREEVVMEPLTTFLHPDT